MSDEERVGRVENGAVERVDCGESRRVIVVGLGGFRGGTGIVLGKRDGEKRR